MWYSQGVKNGLTVGPSSDLLKLGKEYAGSELESLRPDEHVPIGYFNPVRDSDRADSDADDRATISVAAEEER